MKAALLDIQGKKKADIQLPAFFDMPIREDLVMKYVEAMRVGQPYGLNPKAGRRHVASGIISHKRHDWKGQYGKGISRVPRKIMMRRGMHFTWVGAENSGARGGRRPHGPKPYFGEKKINKKEAQLAFQSAFAATAQAAYLEQRYASVKKVPMALPLIVDSLDKKKTKELLAFITTVTGSLAPIAIREARVRAGKGKSRGRKYKVNAGLLLVTGKDEDIKFTGIQVRTVEDVVIADLYPLGRLVMYTQKALEELK